MTKEHQPYLELFGRCTRNHRAHLIYYDEAGRNQESYVHMFAVGAGTVGSADVYRVTCPERGEEYTTLDSGVERKES